MSVLSLPEVPCLNWKQCSVLTFGLSPGMHAAEGRLSFLCCQKKLLTPHMSFYSLHIISTREQEVFLNISWRCVTSEGVGYHCKGPISVKNEVLNAASVWLLKLRRLEHLWCRLQTVLLSVIHIAVRIKGFLSTIHAFDSLIVTCFPSTQHLNSPHSLGTSQILTAVGLALRIDQLWREWIILTPGLRWFPGEFGWVSSHINHLNSMTSQLLLKITWC